MFVTVLVTTPDQVSAELIASRLIESRLAACANFWPIHSIYGWKGAIERGEEFALFLKTRSADFGLIVEVVSSLHPYDNPCVVKYEIKDGAPLYLEWIKESTDRPGEDSARK
jgi:periplasmic divalent cation tolerance protein